MINNLKEFLHNAMLNSFNNLKNDEKAIELFYKYPLGFLFLEQNEVANNIYNYILSQISNEENKDFNTYYDCWLYLYTKLTNNNNSKTHYQSIMKNRSYYGGFSALPNNNPELRSTAISGLCSFFEKDNDILRNCSDFLCFMYEQNEDEKNFYFMLDKNKNLIKNFPIEKERKYIFETQNSKPLLYSFSLSSITLTIAFMIFKKKKYLYFAKKYTDKLFENNCYNDYCGKSLIAVSILYYLLGDNKYYNKMDEIYNYIKSIKFYNNHYVHNEQILTIDRLSEYLISIEFYLCAKNKTLPNFLMSYLIK